MLTLKKIVSYIITSVPACLSGKLLSIFFLWYRISAMVTGKYVIFVLDLKRFRQDIHILRENTNIYYVNFPYWLQDKIIGVIDNSIIKDKEVWLSKFILCLCKTTNSIGFISAGMYYKRHEVWEISTVKAGKGFYCLHREGVGVDKNMLSNSIKEHLKKSRKFKGTKLMVGTESLKDLLISSKYISEDKVVVTGMPRFDKIYFESRSLNKNLKNKGIVLFFSFFVGTVRNFKETGLYPTKLGFRQLFDQVHGVAGLYAISHPGTKVVIKMKWYSGDAKTNVDNAIKGSTGLHPERIKNLSIVDDVPAQELIKKSQVVIGFNSTTLIESILYKKKVIVPLFAEAAQDKYSSDVSCYSDMFYKAHSKNELIKLIGECYLDNNDNLEFDSSFIEETIGPYDGKICNRISNTLLPS
jgi:hypothetical protein